MSGVEIYVALSWPVADPHYYCYEFMQKALETLIINVFLAILLCALKELILLNFEELFISKDMV